jgi:acetyl esterase/lipase
MMNRIARLASATLLLGCSFCFAQVSDMPANIRQWLAEVGPQWSKGSADVSKATEVYTPILRNAPKTGVKVTRDISYGTDKLQKLDLFQPEEKTGVPIVVFVHGGKFVSGKRNDTEEFTANIPTYFARHGMVGITADYRLAPAVQWPAQSEDVGSIVKWIKSHAAQYGGDPNRIYLIGHSAGATAVATYAFFRSLQPPEGSGVSGVVLISGRYIIEAKPDDPSVNNMQAYFGTDVSKYPERSIINHLRDAPRIPVFIVVAEYDNLDRDVWGARLFSAISDRDRACPRFKRLEWHNHGSEVLQFNTPDEEFGREILDFIARGR